MEISYYFECQSFNPDASLSKCFNITMVEARFTFDMEFNDDYKDVNSSKSTELWNQIKPIIMKSFGAVEILLEKLRIFSGSVVIEIEINVSRDLVQDIKSLLNNDKEACKKFLDTKIIDSDEKKCWFKYAQKLFEDELFEYQLIDAAILLGRLKDQVTSIEPNKTTIVPYLSTTGLIDFTTQSTNTTIGKIKHQIFTHFYSLILDPA